MARVRLMGTWKGTLPVTMRHMQSMPELVRVFNALQQSEVGEVPLVVLLVTKFMQGVKLAIMEGLQGVLIWPNAGVNKTAAMASATTSRRPGRGARSSIWFGLVLFCGFELRRMR